MLLIEKVQELQAIEPPLDAAEIKQRIDEWKKSTNYQSPVEQEQQLPEEVKQESSTVTDPGEEQKTDEGSEPLDSGDGQLPSPQIKLPQFTTGMSDEQLDAVRDARKKIEKITAVAMPGEVITKKGYDLKYDTEGNYYYKPEGSDNTEWKTYDDKQSEGNLSIAAQFGHSDFSYSQAKENRKLFEQSEDLLITIDGNLSKIEDPKKDIPLTEEQLKIEDEFLKATALNEKEKNQIKLDVNKWFNSRITESKAYNKRGRLIATELVPNKEWIAAEKESKQAYDSLDQKPTDVTEQEWIADNMKKTYQKKLEKEKAGDKIETWIESQGADIDWGNFFMRFGVAGGAFTGKDTFKKSAIQQKVQYIQETRKLNLNNKQKSASDFAKTAQKTIEAINAQGKIIAEANYQTPQAVAKAKEVLNKLQEKKDIVLDLYKQKVKDLDDTILEAGNQEEINQRLDFLERNFNPIVGFEEELKVSAVNLGISISDLAHMVLDAPDAFGINDAENNPIAATAFNITTPLYALATKFVNSQPYEETRESVKETADNYIEQVYSGIPIKKSLSELKDGSDWGRYFSSLFGSQAINTAILFTTGAAALPILTGVATGSSYGELEKESKQRQKAYDDYIAKGGDPNAEDAPPQGFSPFQIYGVAMSNGGLEFVAERFTLGLVNRARAAYRAMGPSVRLGFGQQLSNLATKKGAKRAANGLFYYGADVVGEGLSEGFVEFGGNWFDRHVLGKEVNLFDGVPDATFSGAVMGNLYKSPGILSSVSTLVQGPDSQTLIANNREKIKELEKTLTSNPEMSEKNKARLENDLIDLVKKSEKEINKSLNRYNRLDRSEIDALGDIELGTYNKLRAIDDIKSDPNFFNKEAEIARIKNSILELEIQKNKILEPYIKEDENIKTQDSVELKGRIVEGVKAVANQLENVGITRFETTEDLLGGIETLKAQGIEVQVDKNSDESIKDAKDQGYGLIVTLPNGTQQVIINDASSEKDGVIPADKHEIVHAFASRMDPAKLVKMGKDLKNKLDNDPNVKLDVKTLNLLNQYESDFNAGNISEATFYEEVMAVISDALTQGGITISQPGKLKGFLNNFLETMGWKQSFKDGNQTIDFLKSFNKDVLSGKGLSQTTLDIAGVQLDTPQKINEAVAKESKRIEDSQEVQNLYDQQGEAAAFDIIQKFKPITNRIVESRSQAPNFDRQLLTDEIETGPRGIFDLIRAYDPDSGVPLAAYINKFLPARAIEASKRVLGEEFTADVTEARGVVTEEVSDTVVEEKPVTKKPTETVEFSQTQIEKINAKDKAEVESRITEATNEAFKGQDVDRFGQTRNVPKAIADIYAGMFGLNPQTITDKTRNYQKTDSEGLTTAKQFLLKNAANDFARLPETKDGFGKGTFLPRNVMNALYKDGKLTGTLKDYMDLIRQKPTKPIYRDAVGQTIRGLLNLHIRNRMFETLVPTTPQRLRGGAKFSKKAKTQRSKRFEVSGEDGIKIMRDVAKRFAKATNTEVIVNGVKLTADNFNSKNPEAISFLKSKLETDLWKYIPLESLTRGTMVDYSTKGDRSFFFDKTEYSEILKKAKQNRESWIKQGNKLDYDTKAIDIAKAAINPAKSTSRYLENYSKGAKQKIDANTKGVEAILQGGANAIKADSANYLPILAIYGTQSDSTSHLIRNMAVDAGITEAYANEKGRGKTVKEHVEPSNEMAPLMFEAQLFDEVDVLMPVVEKVYYQIGITKIQDGKLADTDGQFGEAYNYITTQVEFFQNRLREYFKTGDVSKIPDPLVRYFNPQVNRNRNGDGLQGFNANAFPVKGKTVAEMFTRQLPKADQNPNNIFDQNELTYKVLTGEITQAQAVKLLNNQISPNNLKAKQSKKINDIQPNSLKFEGVAAESTTGVVDELNKLDKALNEGRKLEKPVKKIRVFDFDDTLAKSNSKVIVIKPLSDVDTDLLDIVARRKFKKEFENLPSFKQGFNSLTEQQKLEVLKETPRATTEINATQFAEQAADLEAQGATFDFSQFEQVIEGKKGPLFNVAKKIADTRGTEDLFILTARPQTAAGPIKAFMKALGIDIPLKNITGLANGKPSAKGRWIAGKAAEGYNDFYFADDATKNVKAVKDVLDQIDVKSRVQQVRASKKPTFNSIVNDMIESSSGIESYKTFSAAKARTVGKNKGRFDWLTLASSAEDFKGLLYRLVGNGKKGEAQYEFLKTNLIDVYNRAEDSIVQAKISAANDFMALKSQFPGIPKTLETETGVGKFNYQHALRVYMWTQQNMSIPGLSKADTRKLNKFITDDAKLQAFADQLISIQKGKPYPEPGKDWLAGNLTTDIIGGINKVNRAQYQQQFRENVEIIFSPENLNKMEAAYGTRWRKALENTLKRMKAGTNRLGYNNQTSAVLDWVNNSVGAVMFLNTRSALLQTISAVNFINWGDNNIIKAGQAFANQKQFWGDFMTLMNSDYLVQRRNGLKINVSESEIADAVKDSKNKVNAAISYLLSKGFVLTRYADSFAIASGGATFYRNRIKKYLKEGMDQNLAQDQAFQDFRQIAEESQQSSSPDKISMQQASAAGRVILNWANTPMQYVRIQKRAIQDLIAGRGDAKVHMSRIAYYGVMQNLIFNALQQALFVIGFGDDEDEEKSAAKKKQDDKKIARVANGMIDSQLKGLGIAGAAMVAVKNTIKRIYEESQKDRPEYEAAAIEALSFSPAISSKYRKIVGGLKSFSWNMKEIKQKGFSLDNPAYLAGSQIVTALTNIPIDRVIKKANNIRGILSEQSQMWQKVVLFGGWSTWDVGLPYYGGWDKPVEPTPEEIKKQEFDKLKKDTKTADQVEMLLDLGLTKKEIKALRYEDNRVKKIIELQKKKKDE